MLRKLLKGSKGRFKVARTSFLARGVDYHRASRVKNTNDRGARFKTRKTKTNMAARGFFLPKVTFVLLNNEIRI